MGPRIGKIYGLRSRNNVQLIVSQIDENEGVMMEKLVVVPKFCQFVKFKKYIMARFSKERYGYTFKKIVYQYHGQIALEDECDMDRFWAVHTPFKIKDPIRIQIILDDNK